MFVMPVASQAVEFEIAGEQIVAGVQTPATKSSPPTKPKLAVVAPAPAKYGSYANHGSRHRVWQL